MVNQIETNVWFQRKEEEKFLKKEGIAHGNKLTTLEKLRIMGVCSIQEPSFTQVLHSLKK